MRARQQGVALLAAVLVVALAAVLLAGLLGDGEQSRARTRNTLRAEQTWQLHRGVELWAENVLRRDQEQSPGFDARGEPWALPMPPLPVPGGQLSGLLRDASGCFNLNNLVVDGAERVESIAQFERLLLALRLDPALAEAVADWIDSDGTPRTQGAEDLVYLAQRPAYRAANQGMRHPSELRLVAGVDDEVYRVLRPHVCAWPAPSEINLNFASPQIWMSLDTAITESVARALWRDGQAQYRGTGEVARELELLLGRPVPLHAVSTASEWFVLEAELLVDGLPFVYSSVIRRSERQLDTVARFRGRW